MSFDIGGFVDSAIDTAVEYGTKTFDYVNANEWAADLLTGAAGGALAYMQQKDAQDFTERMLDKKKQQSMVEYGGNVSNSHSLTDGLMASGRPRMRDFARGR